MGSCQRSLSILLTISALHEALSFASTESFSREDWERGGFDFVVCECLCEIFCDYCEPGERWSADWAFVWCDIVLKSSFAGVLGSRRRIWPKSARRLFLIFSLMGISL